MIKSSGAKYVIIGHSERRKYYGETNETLKKKLTLSIDAGLLPIFCCGESIQERKDGIHFEIISKQIETVLFNLSEEEFGKIIVAYEPIWAIGTGETATATQAQEMHSLIRTQIDQRYGAKCSNQLQIIYGGSCNAQNAAELFGMKDVDGGLIGGASLKAPEFIKIIEELIKS